MLVSDEAVRAAVLDDVAHMLRRVLADYDPDDIEITMETTFHDDLELESIDLVDLAGMLHEHYGDRVNLAEFLTAMDVEKIINMPVGTLVDYIAGRLGNGGS